MERMNIIDFIAKYCQDILSTFKDNSKLVEWTVLPYQELIEDDEGKKIPVVYVDGEAVHVRDFLEMEKDEFVYAHNTPSAKEAYENYIEGLEIQEGVDVVMRYRNAAKAEAERIQTAAAELDALDADVPSYD